MQNKILICGALRSGTTFTGKCMSFSSDVFYLWEPFMSKFRKEVNHFYPYLGSSTSSEKRNYYDTLISKTLRLRSLTPRKLFQENPFLESSLTRPNGLISSYFRHRFAQLRFLVLKHHRNTLLWKDPAASFLSEHLMDTYNFKIVVLVRHPAAVHYSRKKLGWIFDRNWWEQPDLKADFYGQELERLRSINDELLFGSLVTWNTIYTYFHQLYKTHHQSMLIIKHEDLCRDPVGIFTKIFDFSQIPFKDHIKQKIVEYTSGDAVNAQTDDKSKLSKRDASALISLWRDKLTDEEISIINQKSSHLLNAYGYK